MLPHTRGCDYVDLPFDFVALYARRLRALIAVSAASADVATAGIGATGARFQREAARLSPTLKHRLARPGQSPCYSISL